MENSQTFVGVFDIESLHQGGRLAISHSTFVQQKIPKTFPPLSTFTALQNPRRSDNMLLQSTIPQSPLHHRRVSLSSPLSFHSLSFPSGFRGENHPAVRCSISQVHSYGTVDYERRPAAKWTGIYKSISLMKDRAVSAASVLNDCEKAGKKLTKRELHRIIKELRKFRRFNRALEVLALKLFWVSMIFSSGKANLVPFMHFASNMTRRSIQQGKMS